MKKAKVGVIGYGTIGLRLADGVASQDDMELVGVSIRHPNINVMAMVDSGKNYPIFASSAELIPEIKRRGFKIAGKLEDLLKKVDIVLDATSVGEGIKNKKLYKKLGVKAIFQGGEENQVGEIIFNTSANYAQALGRDYVKIASCNATGIIRGVAIIDKEFKVEKAVVTVVRRSADPVEIDKGPIDAAIPEKVPAHQGEDLQRVLPHINALTMVVTVPTTAGHVICLNLVTKQPLKRDEVIKYLKKEPRIKIFKKADGFHSTAEIIEYNRNKGNIRYDMSELAIWDESIYTKGKDLYFIMMVHQEAIVTPENIDAIRAMLKMEKDPLKAMAKTNQALGIGL